MQQEGCKSSTRKSILRPLETVPFLKSSTWHARVIVPWNSAESNRKPLEKVTESLSCPIHIYGSNTAWFLPLTEPRVSSALATSAQSGLVSPHDGAAVQVHVFVFEACDDALESKQLAFADPLDVL